MFRKVTVSLDILTDQAKRNYVDTRLESDRRRKEQYAARDKRKQGLVDVSLVSLCQVSLGSGV